MKRSGLILLTAFLAVFTNAQLRVAITGGGHVSSVNETNNLPGWDSVSGNYSSRTGIHFGFMADLQLSHSSRIYFQPGIIFYNKARLSSTFRSTAEGNMQRLMTQRAS